MKQLILMVAAFIIGLSSIQAEKNQLNYYEGDLQSAKNKANIEQKMVFVKFYADWCVPCKWMDETTFSDPSIVGKINQNFVPLKVNIDDFDGFALRQKLGVTVLPTIIVYDSNGKMINRIEETLPTSKMHNELDKVIAKNGKPVIHKVNKSPKKTLNTAIATSNPRPQKRAYKLQLGVFNGFENTMNYLESIKEKVDEQAMVLHDYRDGHTMYKVLIGRYTTEEEAIKAQSELKMRHGLESVIF